MGDVTSSAWHVCQTCGDLHEKRQRCPQARRWTQAQQDRKRGTPERRGYDSDWKSLVKYVLQRDGYVCQVGRRGCEVTATTGDHVVPLSRGGARLDPDNVVAACRRCNSGKRDR